MTSHPEMGEASTLLPSMQAPFRAGTGEARGGRCGEKAGEFRLLILGCLLVALVPLGGCGGRSEAARQEQVSSLQRAVVAADFNGDGRQDVAVCTAFFTDQASFAGEVEVYLQNPARPSFFLAPQRYEVGFDPSHLASADLNGDGLPDLVTANESSDSVSVLLNNPASPGAFLPAVDYATGPQPLWVGIGDVNRDTIPDLVVAAGDAVDILIQNPNAAGRFLSATSLPVTGGTFSVALGDLDGDGLPDIAATGTNSALVFFQNPSVPGAFSAASSFAAGVQPAGLAVADMDLDGLDDIVVANAGSSSDGTNSTISVLLQDPARARNFLPARNSAAPGGTRSVALGDLNGDTLPDIAAASTVIASPNAGVVSVFLQASSAPGNFLFSASYPDGFTPESVAIADFNGDLKRDIAIQDGPSILFQDPAQPGVFLPEVLVNP